jgi:hypothetical protein
MSRLIREICITPKGARSPVTYVEIDLPIKLVNQIFGPRVFDQLNQRWIEDDYEVIWVRTISPVEAQALSAFVQFATDFQFDHDRFDYALITSTD